jgi:hypothetical protein
MDAIKNVGHVMMKKIKNCFHSTQDAVSSTAYVVKDTASDMIPDSVVDTTHKVHEFARHSIHKTQQVVNNATEIVNDSVDAVKDSAHLVGEKAQIAFEVTKDMTADIAKVIPEKLMNAVGFSIDDMQKAFQCIRPMMDTLEKISHDHHDPKIFELLKNDPCVGVVHDFYYRCIDPSILLVTMVPHVGTAVSNTCRLIETLHGRINSVLAEEKKPKSSCMGGPHNTIPTINETQHTNHNH